MDDLEKQLQSILDSPGELSRLAQMAQSLLGGGQAPPAASPAQGDAPAQGGAGEALAALLGGGDGDGGKRALIDALAPYLGEKRRNKLRRAASLTRAARLAEKLLAEQGGWPP